MKVISIVCSLFLLVLAFLILFPLFAFHFEIKDELLNQDPLQIPENTKWQKIFLKTSKIRLNVLTVGDPTKGKVVLFLHGFPQSGLISWHKQLNFFSSNYKDQYFLIAPDLRGYNTSEKPEGVESYKLTTLVQDIVDLINHFTKEKIFIVSHDWGGVIAYHLAIHYPKKVEKLVTINIPHTEAMEHQLKNISSGQLLRSWYIFYFQLPYIAEFIAPRLFPAALCHNSPKTFSRQEIDLLLDSYKISTFTPLLNYYRAILRYKDESSTSDNRIHVPTLILWGEKDVAIIPTLAHETAKYIDDVTVKTFKEYSHWINHEAPELVNKEIIQFFEKSS